VLLPILGESALVNREPPIQNHLLLRLSPEDLRALGPLERVELELRAPLEHADLPVEFAYFMESGMASVVVRPPNNREMEVGIIGREAMTGLSLVYGDTQSPFDTFIQVPGQALRIEIGQLRRALHASPALKDVMLRAARAFSIQVATTAFANGRSKLEERLAR
jgi:CRP-like cAMP-binding protein